MKRLLIFLFCLLGSINSNAQLEFSKWYYGVNNGVDFSTTPPTALSNGTVNALEGCSTICDSNGNLLFYANGTTVRNSQHNVMANGSGLIGNNSSTQASIIVKQH